MIEYTYCYTNRDSQDIDCTRVSNILRLQNQIKWEWQRKTG